MSACSECVNYQLGWCVMYGCKVFEEQQAELCYGWQLASPAPIEAPTEADDDVQVLLMVEPAYPGQLCFGFLDEVKGEERRVSYDD